jgi:hypothetical protein
MPAKLQASTNRKRGIHDEMRVGINRPQKRRSDE